MPSEVEVVAAGRGSVSVLLHLWAKFRNQTRSIVADKGLGNWDDERVCHVKFRWSRTSGTRSIHGISSVSSATRFFRPTVAFGSGSRTAHTRGVKLRVVETKQGSMGWKLKGPADNSADRGYNPSGNASVGRGALGFFLMAPS